MKTLLLIIVLCVAIPFNAGTSAAQRKDPTTVKLKGQVVCSKCYPQADPQEKPYGSEDDIQCAARCAKSGIPSALAVTSEAGTTLYILEKQKSKTDWVNYLGKEVEVTGTVRESGDKRYLKVYVIKLVSAQGT